MVYIGTRDASLMPHLMISMGAKVSTGRDTLTLFLPEYAAEPCLANLRDNGQIAVTMGDVGTHSCFQFKGDFQAARPSTNAEYAIQDLWWDKVSTVIAALPMGTHLTERMRLVRRRPTVAVDIKVREVFNQTPGPGTGQRLNLPEGA